MSTTPHPLDQVGIRFGIAGAGLLIVLITARLAGLDDRLALVTLLVATATSSATVTRGYAALLAVTAWALATGFVTNRYGQLTFARPDVEVLAALVLTSVITSHFAATARTGANRPHVPRRAA